MQVGTSWKPKLKNLMASIRQEQKPLLSVVIPAFNEEARLPPTLNALSSFLRAQSYQSEVIIVTDGSEDRTIEVAQSFGNKLPGLKVLAFAQRMGKGFGVKTGILKASGSFRAFMDADGSVPATFLDPFLRIGQEGYDLVIATREHPDSSILKRQQFLRQQSGKWFGRLQRMVLGIPFKDTQCGFKLFTQEAAEKLFPQMTFQCAYFDAELLYIAYKSNLRIYEHPVTWQHDDETRLPVGARRTFDILRKLYSIKRLHK